MRRGIRVSTKTILRPGNDPMTTRSHNRFEPKAAAAFTILELLVVITIIGILAAVGLPAIRGMTKSNSLVAADRQLLDDLGYARLRAIADHTTVFVVFVPPSVTTIMRSAAHRSYGGLCAQQSLQPSVHHLCPRFHAFGWGPTGPINTALPDRLADAAQRCLYCHQQIFRCDGCGSHAAVCRPLYQQLCQCHSHFPRK